MADADGSIIVNVDLDDAQANSIENKRPRCELRAL